MKTDKEKQLINGVPNVLIGLGVIILILLTSIFSMLTIILTTLQNADNDIIETKIYYCEANHMTMQASCYFTNTNEVEKKHINEILGIKQYTPYTPYEVENE